VPTPNCISENKTGSWSTSIGGRRVHYVHVHQSKDSSSAIEVSPNAVLWEVADRSPSTLAKGDRDTCPMEVDTYRTRREREYCAEIPSTVGSASVVESESFRGEREESDDDDGDDDEDDDDDDEDDEIFSSSSAQPVTKSCSLDVSETDVVCMEMTQRLSSKNTGDPHDPAKDEASRNRSFSVQDVGWT